MPNFQNQLTSMEKHYHTCAVFRIRQAFQENTHCESYNNIIFVRKMSIVATRIWYHESDYKVEHSVLFTVPWFPLRSETRSKSCCGKFFPIISEAPIEPVILQNLSRYFLQNDLWCDVGNECRHSTQDVQTKSFLALPYFKPNIACSAELQCR